MLENEIEIKRVISDRKQYLDLLLDADPSGGDDRSYIEKGDMFVLLEGKTVVGEVVVDQKGETKSGCLFRVSELEGTAVIY